MYNIGVGRVQTFIDIHYNTFCLKAEDGEPLSVMIMNQKCQITERQIHSDIVAHYKSQKLVQVGAKTAFLIGCDKEGNHLDKSCIKLDIFNDTRFVKFYIKAPKLSNRIYESLCAIG